MDLITVSYTHLDVYKRQHTHTQYTHTILYFFGGAQIIDEYIGAVFPTIRWLEITSDVRNSNN